MLEACFPGWGGRRVLVIEASPEWEHVAGRNEEITVWQVDLAETWPRSRESFTTPAQPAPRGNPIPSRILQGCALFIHSRLIGDRYPRWSGEDLGVEIVIPAGAIDPVVVAIAVDAMLEGDKRAAWAVLAQCGLYAGIALALVEAKVKTLRKGEAGATYQEAA